jgi:DNA adenine methylase
MRYITPLRYPGGKAGLAPWLARLLESNGLGGLHYVEPFAGGAGLAFAMLDRAYASSVHINDSHPGVYAFWKSVLEQPDELCELIRKTPVTVTSWRRQLALLAAHRKFDRLHVGFAFLFVNRVSRSGIVGGGVIGGLNQDGDYAIDARFNKSELSDRIQAIAMWRHCIRVTRADGCKVLEQYVRADEKHFLFIDPPYYVNGKRLYPNALREEDHASVANIVKRLRPPWVLSYDEHPAIRRLYQGCKSVLSTPLYTANEARRGTERIFARSSLRMPRM